MEPLSDITVSGYKVHHLAAERSAGGMASFSDTYQTSADIMRIPALALLSKTAYSALPPLYISKISTFIKVIGYNYY